MFLIASWSQNTKENRLADHTNKESQLKEKNWILNRTIWPKYESKLISGPYKERITVK